jgi:NitT/TauT family transport system permease protein
VEFLRPIPSVALIPLVIVLLGIGPETKITLAVYAALWPLLFNTIYAMSEIDPVQVDTARAFGLSRSRILWTVRLPHAAPFVMTGVRISASIALILVISTELLAGGSGGLGQVIFDAGSGGGRMDVVLAATLVAGVIGFVGNSVLERVQRRWLGWDEQIDAGR